MKSTLIIGLLAAAMLLFNGCHYRGHYQSIQQSNQRECGKLPASEYEDCLQRHQQSYDDYRREREEVLNREEAQESE